jgi:hypothetical protein
MNIQFGDLLAPIRARTAHSPLPEVNFHATLHPSSYLSMSALLKGIRLGVWHNGHRHETGEWLSFWLA